MLRFGSKEDLPQIRGLYKSVSGKIYKDKKIFPCLILEEDGVVESALSFKCVNTRGIWVTLYVSKNRDYRLLKELIALFYCNDIWVCTGRWNSDGCLDSYLIENGFRCKYKNKRTWVKGINCNSLCDYGAVHCSCSEHVYFKESIGNRVWASEVVGNHIYLSTVIGVGRGTVACIKIKPNRVVVDYSCVSENSIDIVGMMKTTRDLDKFSSRLASILDTRVDLVRMKMYDRPEGFELAVENAKSVTQGKSMTGYYNATRYNLYVKEAGHA